MSINIKTTKNAMERYLNDNPPLTDPRFMAMRRKRQWGRHLYINWRKEFNHLFNTWWKKHPELWNLPCADETPKESRRVMPCAFFGKIRTVYGEAAHYPA